MKTKVYVSLPITGHDLEETKKYANQVKKWLEEKCDSLAFEKIGKHDSYLGRRKKRGLFQSSVGKLINADVNGALNIMRKAVGDSCESICRIIDRGLLFNPVRITNVFC